MPAKAPSHRLLYALVFLSGACGLIYEVVWQRYLAILLGAQARATAVILAIFLGGMAFGYAKFGRWSRWKPWNLLLVYSFVEMVMGIWGVAFPGLFQLARWLAAHLYGSLGVTNLFIDLLISILLIGFPTFLMGGTLPLLTQGISRDFWDASLKHARIYGFNTVGACLGCLLTGYFFIPRSSLGGTVQLAGSLNLLIGGIAYFAYARNASIHKVTETAARRESLGISERQAVLLAIGFLSGFYLLALQTVIIRLVGMTVGSSHYNFSLIVTIFIFCLGISSLLVRDLGKAQFDRLFWNQLAVSAFLFLLYLSGDYWSYGAHVLRASLRDLPETFFFYQFLLGGAFLLVLMIPIGLCGFTLPLCFHLLKDTKESLGHRVGQLYGANSLGCVLGALFGGYYLLNFINLDQLFKVCVFLATMTAGLSAYLLAPQAHKMRTQLFIAGGVLTMTLAGVLLAPRYDPQRFLQPFRYPAPVSATFEGAEAFGNYLARSTKLVVWKDGPNTSVGIGANYYKGQEVTRSIIVNGKSDGNTRGDFFTTSMLAHLPGLFQASLDRTAVIGFGTGVTVGTLAQYPDAKQIDVIEIANTIIENAGAFDKYNYEASRNPKVRFHEMDAFRYFGGTQQKYNVIISEPSNPWVAGIENLYSQEFYRIARNQLDDQGVFVQWIHTYSFNDHLMQMVVRTMTREFPAVYVFQLRGGDLALIGRNRTYTRQDIVRAAQRFQTDAKIRALIEDTGVKQFESVLALELIPAAASRAFAGEGEIHTLESPRLSNAAARAFYANESANVYSGRRAQRDFFGSLETAMLPVYLGRTPLSRQVIDGFRSTFCDNPPSRNGALCEETVAYGKYLDTKYAEGHKFEEGINLRELAGLEAFHQRIDVNFSQTDLQTAYKMFENYKHYASPLAHIPPERFLAPVDQCLRTVEKEKELYGECLLQKILILQTVPVATYDLGKVVNEYLEWFPTLSNTATAFDRLKEARNILLRMAAQK